MYVSTLLADAAARLAHSPSPRLDAEVLLAHVLGVTRTYLYTWPDKTVAPAQMLAFETLLARRAAGEPVAYLTGTREFWSLPLQVSPAVLIPRPETELLVEWVLACLPAEEVLTVLDLGTGCGAIALALAHERPQWRVLATDASCAALEIARANARRLALNNVEFIAADWLAPFVGAGAAAIVSNPPYIAATDPHLEQGDVRYEPRSALQAGLDGLDDVRRIIAEAGNCLRRGGGLWLEHGYNQGAPVRELLRAAGYREVATHADLAGLERTSSGWIR